MINIIKWYSGLLDNIYNYVHFRKKNIISIFDIFILCLDNFKEVVKKCKQN